MKAPITDEEELNLDHHQTSGALSQSLTSSIDLSAGRACLILFAVWSALLLLLLVLQLSGTGMGLKVWPMGEDRTWIQLLQNNHGAGVARAFWLINDRNPLSPWWYVLVSPLVTQFDYGIYIVRKLVDLVLALSSYVLFARLFARQLRPAALAISLLVLVWNFSFYYTEQIMWNFLVALSATNLSMWSYLKFIDSKRSKTGYMGASLVLYFVAFASYSIQCGAPLAVFCLSWLRADRSVRGLERWLSALADTAAYGGLFLLFTLTWVTTSRPSSDYYALSPALFVKQFGPSLQGLLWQSDYADLLSGIFASWHPALTALSFCALIWATFSGFRKIVPPEFFSTGASNRSNRIFSDAARDLVVVIAAISIPTLLLESMSGVWFPGTRVRMIAQEVSPCLITLVASGAAFYLGRKKDSTARLIFTTLLAVVCSAGILMGLQYNKQLTTQTTFERNLGKGLRSLVNPELSQQYFLVKLDGVNWPCSPFLNDTYIQTVFHNKQLSMRVLQTEPAPKAFERSWRVKFGDERTGIKYADFTTAERRVPWKQAVFVTFDGKYVRVVNPVRAGDLTGLQADFEASEPIPQLSPLASLTTIKGKP